MESKQGVMKLNGRNWVTWKLQMRHLLLEKEIWEYVEGSVSVPRTTATQNEFKKKTQKALTAIILSIEADQLYIVESCETPEEAWRCLRSPSSQSWF